MLEVTAPNVAAVESTMPKIFGDKEWQANYAKMSDLVESGYREVFTSSSNGARHGALDAHAALNAGDGPALGANVGILRSRRLCAERRDILLMVLHHHLHVGTIELLARQFR